MNLPDGIKQAVSTAANEVFLEILGDIADDPEGGLEQYGATYQTMMAEGVMPEPQMRSMLADLAAWDSGPAPTTTAELATHLEQTWLAAGKDVARAIVALATGAGEVPAAIAPYQAELAPLVTALKDALDAGFFDEEEVDLQAMIWD